MAFALGWNEPLSQGVHSAVPSPGALYPGEQGRHVLLLGAPTSWLCVPGGHGRQVELLDAPNAPLYEPEPHGTNTARVLAPEEGQKPGTNGE